MNCKLHWWIANADTVLSFTFLKNTHSLFAHLHSKKEKGSKHQKSGSPLFCSMLYSHLHWIICFSANQCYTWYSTGLREKQWEWPNLISQQGSGLTENRTRIILTLSDAVWAFLSALQCDARGRYSRGRLIEETEEREREGGGQRKEGRGSEWEDEGGIAVPVDFRDVSLYCVRISIDFSSCLTRGSHVNKKTPHTWSHTHQMIAFRLLERKGPEGLGWEIKILLFTVQTEYQHNHLFNNIRFDRFTQEWAYVGILWTAITLSGSTSAGINDIKRVLLNCNHTRPGLNLSQRCFSFS